MSQYACKLLTDKGVYYVAFCSVVDQFISSASTSIEPIAKIVEVETEVCQEAAEHNVFDLRREARHRAINHIAKLKHGKALTDDEACELGKFVDFLEATVAPHQDGLTMKDISVISGWIEKLGLRKRYPKYDWWEIVQDKALYPAFQSQELKRKYPNTEGVLNADTMTAEQYKLAGLYVGKLALIANIAGPKKSTPVQIVRKFFRKFS